MKKKKLLKGSGVNLMMSIFDVGMFTIKNCKKNPEIMFAIIMTESGGDEKAQSYCCLLYTSDAADDLLCVGLGGRRIIKNTSF